MDKQYLAEHNLLEAQKKFQKIVEYSFIGGKPVDEAGDTNDPTSSAPAPDADPSMGGGMPGGDPSMGGAPGADPSMGGGMPGGDPSMGGAPGDPSMGGTPADDGAADGSQGVPEFQPQVNDPSMGGGMPGGDPSMQCGEDEDIIDVDDLTDSQKATEEKVDKLSDKLDRLEKFLDAFDKIESNIQANTEHLEQLRQDFEKRNPTQVEKMTLRAKQGYPFSQSPDEYWDGKEAEGKYSPEDDNNGVGDQRYQITKNDVDNMTDWASIYKSIDDGSFHQNLKDILNL